MVSITHWLSVTQDNAPAHAPASTKEDMSQRLIQLIFWLANPPDLNPIEAVRNKMKDYIQHHQPNMDGGKQRSPNSLRNVIKEVSRVARTKWEVWYWRIDEPGGKDNSQAAKIKS
ncbi:Bgt-51297 [Blumeria graminis f. sp. tritici]|uniref:Bgt-51297 n=1 Tax=Blumeria graminis f. sp. tritici TaxID=62690 RepID=A0A9X9MLN5_BLUGR|nr:Bgt-51297 [Blumeria graminis f. sp. tritici]